eukprot:158290_1
MKGKYHSQPMHEDSKEHTLLIMVIFSNHVLKARECQWTRNRCLNRHKPPCDPKTKNAISKLDPTKMYMKKACAHHASYTVTRRCNRRSPAESRLKKKKASQRHKANNSETGAGADTVNAECKTGEYYGDDVDYFVSVATG